MPILACVFAGVWVSVTYKKNILFLINRFAVRFNVETVCKLKIDSLEFMGEMKNRSIIKCYMPWYVVHSYTQDGSC